MLPMASNSEIGFINPEAIVEGFGLQAGMKAADFGSGAGHFSLAMAKKVGPSGVITAVDILESTLQVLRAKAAAGGLNNVQTVRADLEVVGGTGLPDQSQQLVLIANVLFQSQKQAEIIREAKRTLDTGGRLAVIEWKKSSAGLGPPMEIRLDTEQVKTLVASEGFSLIQEINVGAWHFGLMFRKVT